MKSINISLPLIESMLRTGNIIPKTEIIEGLKDDEFIVDITFNSNNTCTILVDSTEVQEKFITMKRLE